MRNIWFAVFLRYAMVIVILKIMDLVTTLFFGNKQSIPL